MRTNTFPRWPHRAAGFVAIAALLAGLLAACSGETAGQSSSGPAPDAGGNCSAGLDECPAIDECHDSSGYGSCGNGCAEQDGICSDNCAIEGDACHNVCPTPDLSSACHTECNKAFNTCLLEDCAGKTNACICKCLGSFGCCDNVCSCH